MASGKHLLTNGAGNYYGVSAFYAGEHDHLKLITTDELLHLVFEIDGLQKFCHAAADAGDLLANQFAAGVGGEALSSYRSLYLSR